MTDFPVGEHLSDGQLALARRLPLKPEATTFEGETVVLRPFDRFRDEVALHTVSNGPPVRLGDRSIGAYDADALVWRYLFGGPFASAPDLGAYLADIADAANFRAFTVFERTSEHAIGFIAYTSNMPEHLKIELGHIWYAPVMQRSPANLEFHLPPAQARLRARLSAHRVEVRCAQ